MYLCSDRENAYKIKKVWISIYSVRFSRNVGISRKRLGSVPEYRFYPVRQAHSSGADGIADTGFVLFADGGVTFLVILNVIRALRVHNRQDCCIISIDNSRS